MAQGEKEKISTSSQNKNAALAARMRRARGGQLPGLFLYDFQSEYFRFLSVHLNKQRRTLLVLPWWQRNFSSFPLPPPSLLSFFTGVSNLDSRVHLHIRGSD